MGKTTAHWIEELQLLPHPEGGFYREYYQSPLLIRHNGLDRPVSTAIWFLMPEGAISAWHRLDADELWHYHSGGVLLIHSWQQNELITVRLDGENLCSYLVPANTWFATEVEAGSQYALSSCTVAPGFSFERFSMATMDDFRENNWPPQVRRLIKVKRPESAIK